MVKTESSRRTLRLATHAAAVVAVALYFLQSATLAPNHTDEGLILGYIDDMAHGQRPFYDFVDAYGLLNWVFPVLFYKVAGYEVWGVRLWMVILKTITVATAYLVVSLLAEERTENGARPGRFYSVTGAIWTMVLLGAQWQSLQTAYAFITVLPLVLGGWYFLLRAPSANGRRDVIAAAVLTAAAIWTKLNTGMYLLAGGLFAYFFWMPVKVHAGDSWRDDPPGEAERARFRRVRTLGTAVYAALFAFFVRQHFNVWFFLYLILPLLVGLGWTLAIAVRRAPDDVPLGRHLGPWALYLVASVALSVIVLIGYYGKHTPLYIRELSGILSNIHYTAPFPELGRAGYYVGLNEYYWLQLPLLLTGLFVVWTVLAERVGPRAFGATWSHRRAQVSALFVLVTLHSFVMYARSDETHIYQTLVLVAPVVFAMAAQLDAFLHAWRPRLRLPLRIGVLAVSLWYTRSLWVLPEAGAFQLSHTDWKNPKLRYLQYRARNNPYVKDFSPDLPDHDWDMAEDATAALVRKLTRPGDEMLLLTANRLMYLNSDTRPVGGRYHFFFYLASVGLLDRQGFDRLVPRDVIRSVLVHPPRVIVAAYGYVPLAILFPELAWMRDHWYRRVGEFKHIWVYEFVGAEGPDREPEDEGDPTAPADPDAAPAAP